MRKISLALYSAQRLLAMGLRQLCSGPEARLTLLELPLPSEDPEWLEAVKRENPDVIVVDAVVDPPLRIVAVLRSLVPASRIVLLAAEPTLSLARSAIDLGARGILRADASEMLLIRCFERVAEGELWFDRDLRDGLTSAVPIQLSRREYQLVILVARGQSNKEIAQSLGLTEGTVKFYLSRVFRKCGVTDRLSLALFGLKQVFLEKEDLHDPRELEARRLPHRLLFKAEVGAGLLVS